MLKKPRNERVNQVPRQNKGRIKITTRWKIAVRIMAPILLFSGVVFASDVAVEGLNIKKHDSNTWGIFGKIRNLESHAISGSVKIKFLNANGDITVTHRAKVNDGDPINPGQAGPFKYWDKPSEFTGVSDYQVIFVDK